MALGEAATVNTSAAVVSWAHQRTSARVLKQTAQSKNYQRAIGPTGRDPSASDRHPRNRNRNGADGAPATSKLLALSGQNASHLPNGWDSSSAQTGNCRLSPFMWPPARRCTGAVVSETTFNRNVQKKPPRCANGRSLSSLARKLRSPK
eukprot:4866485-Pyramimonas_sp.AAC.1